MSQKSVTLVRFIVTEVIERRTDKFFFVVVVQVIIVAVFLFKLFCCSNVVVVQMWDWSLLVTSTLFSANYIERRTSG